MYGGANGSKISVIYNGERYMLKFAPHGKDNRCITEYLGCHILQSLGIHTQDTLLGTYEVNNDKKLLWHVKISQ